MRCFALLFLCLLAAAPCVEAAGPTVPGNVAVLRGRKAYAPANAPQCVKEAIWALNTIVGKPYRWGGGHGTFRDVGYDCSGTVSFALNAAGLLAQPAPSRGFLSWGESGRGRWITVYARKGHVFAVIAGLRMDTTGERAEQGPGWRDWSRDPRGFVARHPRGL